MITDKVREYLKNAPANRLTLPCAADALGMSESGLRNRLRGENTTFLVLRDAERRTRALALLQRNPHADTAAMIRVTGYGEASISRAVKRWFGCTLPQARLSA
jgi:AraC-like DNA-binding protein